MGLDVEATGKELGNRLRGVIAALERLDRFAIAPGREGPAEPGLPSGREREAARIFVLRALRQATDPVGWRVLQLLRDTQRSSADLAGALGCPRVAAWEAVNDLVQAGLAARAADADQAGLTAAGAGLLSFIEELAAAAAAVARP
ncbi:MAG: hypothetical protein ACM3ML_15535 [Micromonosporaceae bacterium]